MKKTFYWHFLFLVFLSIGIGFTSCSDDDEKDEKSEEQKAEEQIQQEDLYWSVLGELAGASNITDDQDATYEPIIGKASESNPYVRIVATNNMETAALRFADLIGEPSIDENTTSFEWKNDALGTLSYKKTTDGTSLATVDVKIKQLPHLQQIVYQTGEQMGDNSSFDGTAYYRFGDVISKVNSDGGLDYWICVRPAFGPEEKEKTHWISLSKPAKENRWEYDASTGYHYSMPTKIYNKEEHRQNLAEMFYAMLYPKEWKQNIVDNPKLPMFNDFSHENIKYHNEFFWANVCKAWESKSLFSAIFGPSLSSAAQVRDYISNQGLNLLYKGYSWLPTFSWNLTLYEAKYTVDDGGDVKKKNMHNEHLRNIKKDVSNIKFSLDNYFHFITSEFFDGVPHYVLRYATGKELAGSDPGTGFSLKGPNNSIEDVYTYNKTYGIPVGPQYPPEETKESVKLDVPEPGCMIGEDGNFYKDIASMKKLKITPAAMVVYVGPKAVEGGKDYNGLAMALSEHSMQFSSEDTHDAICFFRAKNLSKAAGIRNGMAAQEFMGKGCGKGHVRIQKHPFTDMNTNFSLPKINSQQFSNWFIPSVGQYILACEGFGMHWENNRFTVSKAATQKFKDATKAAGFKEITMGINLVTATEAGRKNCYYFSFGQGEEPILRSGSKKSLIHAIPFIAFTTGTGATIDEDIVTESDEDDETHIGWVIGANGNFYKDADEATSAGTKAAALVVYENDKGSVETDTDYRGLAIALENLPDKHQWNSTSDQLKVCLTGHTAESTTITENLNGIYLTSVLAKDCAGSFSKLHDHSAAKACMAYNAIDENVRKAKKMSSWFLPSIGQWTLALRELGGIWDGSSFEIDQDITELTKVFKKAKVENAIIRSTYWSSSEYSTSYAWYATIDMLYGLKLGREVKTEKSYVRPFIAY